MALPILKSGAPLSEERLSPATYAHAPHERKALLASNKGEVIRQSSMVDCEPLITQAL